MEILNMCKDTRVAENVKWRNAFSVQRSAFSVSAFRVLSKSIPSFSLLPSVQVFSLPFVSTVPAAAFGVWRFDSQLIVTLNFYVIVLAGYG
jgi:hypothetical protein